MCSTKVGKSDYLSELPAERAVRGSEVPDVIPVSQIDAESQWIEGTCISQYGRALSNSSPYAKKGMDHGG